MVVAAVVTTISTIVLLSPHSVHLVTLLIRQYGACSDAGSLEGHHQERQNCPLKGAIVQKTSQQNINAAILPFLHLQWSELANSIL